MENRFDKIDQKLDIIDARLHALTSDHQQRITKLETTQKGIVTLCLAIITSAFAALAKALHLV